MWKATSCCRIPSLAMWMQSAIETLRPWRKSGFREFPRIVRYHRIVGLIRSREPRTRGKSWRYDGEYVWRIFADLDRFAIDRARASLVSDRSLDK